MTAPLPAPATGYRVVAGVDGSGHGDAALRWALDEAESHDGEVVAVFAWQMPFVSNPAAFSKDEMGKSAREFLIGHVSSIVPSPRVPLTPLIAEGDPAEVLVAAAADAQLLVVGTRGRSPFMGAVVGAVSLRCASAARCPVTLVKLPGEAAEMSGPAPSAS